MKNLFRILPAGLLLGALLALQPAAAACNDPAHRQFDFWVGEWQVMTPDGRIAGVNVISPQYDGCVLRERYETGGGYRGESFNVYDAARKVWHQTWVDNRGRLLLLEGGLRDGNMVLEGRSAEPDGQFKRHRISWTPRPDGSVTQLWESSDAGEQWSIVFYGIYRRR